MANKKDFRVALYYVVSAAVSRDVKSKLYEIAYRENTTVSELARRLLEKAVKEYEEVNDYGN